MQSHVTIQEPNIQIPDKPEKTGKLAVWKPFLQFIAKAKLPYLWIALLTVICLFQTKLSLMFPQYTEKLLSGDLSKKIVYGSLAVIIGQSFISVGISYLRAFVNARITRSFRKSIWKSLVHAPVPFFDKNMAKEMISRTTNDTTTLSDFFSDSIATLISTVYQIAGTFLILFTYDWRLAITEAIIIPILIYIGFLNGRINFKYSIGVQASLAKLTEFLSEILTNIPLVKTFVNEKKEEERGNVCIDKLYKTKFKLSIFTSVFSTVANLTKVLQAIIAIVLGIYLVSKNVITVAVWVAFYLYIDGLWNSINTTINIWTKLKTCQGSARRITEIAMEPSENYQNSLTYEKKNSDIYFENVSFKYDQNDILNNLTFKIPDGKVTAIVGPSGAGKTTIFNLMERFYTPDSGNIRRGDVSISEYQLQDWRKAFGYVSQDTKLFSGTIRDNIAYGVGRKVTDEEIEKAAEAANALEFIKAFDDGFDTQVGEGGSKLSGGQRQRVAIARAILKDPEYLLLDEATSSLDAESEYMVQQALKKLVIGRTAIIIAHRLSTVEDADQIIVIESGKVNGVGNHKNLLENNKLYKQLVEMQLKTEIC